MPSTRANGLLKTIPRKEDLMKVEFRLKASYASTPPERDESFSSIHVFFVKTEDISIQPQIGWKKAFVPNGKEGTIKSITMSNDGTKLIVFMEADDLLITASDVRALHQAGWKDGPTPK